MSSSTVLRGEMVMELTSAMEAVALSPDDGVATTTTPPQPPLSNPALDPTRPYDHLGPPVEPVPFPPPRFCYGKRAHVLCYNPETDQHDIVQNVLFRDFSRRSSIAGGGGQRTTGSSSNDYCAADNDAGDARVREAYWRIPGKAPIKTIMGHVEICIVLERCLRQASNTDDDDDSCERSESGNEDEEDDIVFQWTKRRVAIKVNYYDRMDRLRHRHAEDPLKEIAAMQLIGDNHPNVLGCKEVLFDGKNLNVVMRYCNSGDLFQLLQDSQQRDGEGGLGVSEGQGRYWFRQVMAGVQHLHKVGICHRDLSPENVMIDDGGSLIIDMGMCLRVPYIVPLHDPNRVMDISEATQCAGAVGGTPRRCLFKPQGACGKLPYMSPEIYKNRTSFDGSAADVWTAGTILFCIVTGNRSYQRPHPSDPQFYWMTRGLTQLLSDWGVNLSPEGVHLLQNMLQVDPRLRLTLDEVINHPWFSFPDEPPTHLVSHLRD